MSLPLAAVLILASGTFGALAGLFFNGRSYDRGRADGYREGMADGLAHVQDAGVAEYAECQQILADFMAAQEVER